MQFTRIRLRRRCMRLHHVNFTVANMLNCIGSVTLKSVLGARPQERTYRRETAQLDADSALTHGVPNLEAVDTEAVQVGLRPPYTWRLCF